MKNIFLIFSTILIFASCSGNFFDTVVEVDPPEYEKNLVLNCMSESTDSFIKISLTRNVGLFETISDTARFVHGATIEWLENGVVKHVFTRDTFQYDPFSNEYKFYGTNIPKGSIANGTFEIRASHPDFPSISATQTMPAIVPLTSADLKLDTTYIDTFNNFVYTDAIFTLKFKDPPGVLNFYEIDVASFDDQFPIYLSTDDVNVTNGLSYGKILISDKNFDGQNYTLRLRGYGNQADAYLLNFRSISKELFEFSTAVPKNQDASFNPFASPVQVPTNVTGGLGIFGLSNNFQVILQ
jgi:hypothetical protein